MNELIPSINALEAVKSAGYTEEYGCYVETEKGRVQTTPLAAYAMLVSWIKQTTTNDGEPIVFPDGQVLEQSLACEAIDAAIKACDNDAWKRMNTLGIDFTVE